MADALTAMQTLERDLRETFGGRLQSLVRYGAHARPAAHDNEHGAHGHHHHPVLTHTLAIVDSVTADDLRGCAARVEAWHHAGLATPLIMPGSGFSRSLSVFPFEFSSIPAYNFVVYGRNPFESVLVTASDVRRACE